MKNNNLSDYFEKKKKSNKDKHAPLMHLKTLPKWRWYSGWKITEVNISGMNEINWRN